MSHQMPITSSPFDKVIRAVAAVKTRGGFAAWNLLLLAMTFSSLLLFGGNITTNQMWVLIVFFVCWQGFAVFALLKLPQAGNKTEGA
jgi:hypothetical protein